MLIEPVYIKVLDGSRPLRVVAFRASPKTQLVRLWAMHSTTKTSSMAWRFEPVELRPEYRREATCTIPRLNLPSYFLAMQVYSNAGQGWSRSKIKDSAPLEVPTIDLAFEDEDSTGNGANGEASVIVSIAYS